MKKSLLVLVALFTMILIPWEVKAADVETFEECNMVPKGDKKVTTCQIGWENKSTKNFKGGVTTITFKPASQGNEHEFTLNSAAAKKESETDKTITLYIEPIAAGEKAVVGTLVWTADAKLSSEDCAGNWSPSTFKGSETTDGGSGEGDVVESGYAIPYVALALGAVGVVTVLATSKKKTKMYKI